MSDYLTEMIKGFQSKDPRFIDLGNHSGKEETHILTEIPFDLLGDLSQIKGLFAKNNNIQRISARIGEMTALESLDLSENPLLALPDEIGNLQSLKVFRASDCMEVDLEKMMEDLSKRTPGHHPTFLGEGGLRTLPDSFGNLTQLESLTLDGNRLTEIPSGIFKLKNLVSLDLFSNLITHISPEIGHLTSLRYLKLTRNNFHELPDEIGHLKNLQRLRLDYLDLWALPKGIGGLSSLQMLEVCHGRLGDIPAEIQHLKNLKWIYLINTEISETGLNALKIFAPQAEIAWEMNWE